MSEREKTPAVEETEAERSEPAADAGGRDEPPAAAGEPGDQLSGPVAGDAEGAESTEEVDELASARAERDRYLDLAQRAQAELENMRKRISRETGEAERRGRAVVVRDLAPAIDNLERALLASGIEIDGEREEPTEPVSEEVSARRALAEGVALVYRELTEALKRSGIEAFDPTGEPFDPSMHDAVQTLAAGEQNSGKVVETLSRGYRIDGQVLRAASVVVGE